MLSTRDGQSIFELRKFCTHSLQILCHQGNTVRFLDPQLLRVADGNSIACVGSNRRQHRKFIDDLRRKRASDLSTFQAIRRDIDLYRTDQLAMMLVDVEHFDLATKRSDHIEQGGSGRIHANRVKNKIRIRKQECSAKEEGSGRKVTRDCSFDTFESLATRDTELLPRARKRRSKSPQSML